MAQMGGLRAGAGRKKGSLNKRTLAIQEILEWHQCDPFEGMVRVARKAEEEGDLATAGRLYAELAQYRESKRKAIDPLKLEERRQERLTLDELLQMRQKLLALPDTTTPIIQNPILSG